MGVAGCGHGILAAALTGGICRGGQSYDCHECARVGNARAVAAFRHGGHGDGARHATEAPGVDRGWQCLVQALPACGRRVHRAAIFWPDNVRCRGGTDDVAKPPEGSRAPGGLARLADIVPEPKRLEPALGRLEVSDGIVTGPAEVTERCIFPGGDIDRGEVTSAPQPRQVDGVTTVGFDAVPGLVRPQGGGHDPAGVALVRQIPGEPVAPGAGVIAKDQGCGRRWPRADERIAVPLARAHGTQVGNVGAVIGCDGGHIAGILGDIHADSEWARVVQG
jgi:hypothetical protein